MLIYLLKPNKSRCVIMKEKIYIKYFTFFSWYKVFESRCTFYMYSASQMFKSASSNWLLQGTELLRRASKGPGSLNQSTEQSCLAAGILANFFA